MEAVKIWALKRIVRLSWAEKKSNTRVLRAEGVTFIKTIKKRYLKFMESINRRGGINNLALCQ